MKAARQEKLISGKWLEFIYDDNGTHKEFWELVEVKLPRRQFNTQDFEEIYARFCDATASGPSDDTEAYAE